MEGFRHEPVLRNEVVELLALRPGARCFDGTLGAGGHARALLDATAPDGTLLAVDRDPEACEAARRALAPYGGRVTIVQAVYAEIGALMEARGLGGFDAMLLDLGVSSPQLDRGARGFSFLIDGPLDMRMGEGAGPTAADLVNRLPERELADILYRYGDERNSRRVARRIALRRARKPFERTGELAAAVASAFPPVQGRRRLHPATRTFMALRIVVNDELGELERFLEDFPRRLAPGGRLAVISYHSLEDRLVKERMRDEERRGREALDAGAPRIRRVTRKPVRPSEAETERNPRARSARLRVAERVADEAEEGPS